LKSTEVESSTRAAMMGYNRNIYIIDIYLEESLLDLDGLELLEDDVVLGLELSE
jgi:hypothetical protein